MQPIEIGLCYSDEGGGSIVFHPSAAKPMSITLIDNTMVLAGLQDRRPTPKDKSERQAGKKWDKAFQRPGNAGPSNYAGIRTPNLYK